MGVRIVSVVGARPQFIKAAVVSRALRALPDVQEILLHTGQHYDANMSDVFFSQLEIPEPDYHLGIGSATHGVQTGRMLESIEQVLLSERPDWALVYGDTNSTLAGALAAAKLHIPVAHVEAGLRSFNRQMPEEINRVVADHVSDLLFAPTETAVQNLQREGVAADRIAQVGDVMYDAALFYGPLADSRSRVLEENDVRPGQYVLATVHRAENTDAPERLSAILQGSALVAQSLPVVMPLHPRTRAALEQAGLSIDHPSGLQLIDPVGYLDMVRLERNAAVIATDSGGVQKEAFFYRVPCVTLRDETEWVELVQLGWNRVAPPSSAQAVAEAILSAVGTRGELGAPYGDGHAAEQIAERLRA